MFFKEQRDETLITAHSGAEDTQTNSLDFLNISNKLGAQVIELDLQISKDGVPLFHHDPIIKTENETLMIKETNYAVLKEKAPYPLYNAEDLLPILSETTMALNLDVKDHEAVTPILPLISKYKLNDRTIASGLHLNEARIIKKECPELEIMLNLDNELTEAKNENRFDETLNQGINDAAQLGCLLINMEHIHATKEILNQIHSKGMGLSLWTVDDKELLKKYISLGADSITTCRIAKMKEAKEELHEAS